MKWTRRKFLSISSVALLPRSGSAELTEAASFDRPLRLPGAEGLFGELKLHGRASLTARRGSHRLLPGRPTDLLAFETASGPTSIFNPFLRARRGEDVEVELVNALGEDSTIHWHGLSIDEANDGSGMHPVPNGERFTYRFKVRDPAGLYWYHAHPHDRTGAQVQLGLASALLIEDDEDDALRRELDLAWGETEIPLFIQDKQVDDRNRIRYAMGEDDWIGNRFFVNWTWRPEQQVPRRVVRFRIANASNARLYLLAFTSQSRKLPFALIGTDGGLLRTSQQVQEIFLAPAQRIDVLVDFSDLDAGTPVSVESLRYEAMDNAPGEAAEDPMREHPGAPMMGHPVTLMKLRVRDTKPQRIAIPRTLSSDLEGPPRAEGTREFALSTRGAKWTINRMNYHDDMRAIHFTVRRGAKEEWIFRNDLASMPHPMHVHGFHGRIMSRAKSPAQARRLAVTRDGLLPQDLGRQDTFLIWPGEAVRVAYDLKQPFSGIQRYMLHCHNLEHEDQGMMLNFAVVD